MKNKLFVLIVGALTAGFLAGCGQGSNRGGTGNQGSSSEGTYSSTNGTNKATGGGTYNQGGSQGGSSSDTNSFKGSDQSGGGSSSQEQR